MAIDPIRLRDALRPRDHHTRHAPASVAAFLLAIDPACGSHFYGDPDYPDWSAQVRSEINRLGRFRWDARLAHALTLMRPLRPVHEIVYIAKTTLRKTNNRGPGRCARRMRLLEIAPDPLDQFVELLASYTVTPDGPARSILGPQLPSGPLPATPLPGMLRRHSWAKNYVHVVEATSVAGYDNIGTSRAGRGIALYEQHCRWQRIAGVKVVGVKPMPSTSRSEPKGPYRGPRYSPAPKPFEVVDTYDRYK